jgi:hypothetical protein
MKRFLFCLLAIALFWSCHPRSEGPKRLVEDGIEVVDNGTGVFPSSEGPRFLSLKEEFRIDLEDEALAAAGLADIATIDADSKGRIYLFRRGAGQGPVVFQFDDRGRFLKSFCTVGQGPGEVEYPQFLRISAADEIRILSHNATRLVYYDSEGHFLRQSRVSHDVRLVQNKIKALANGNYVAQYQFSGKDMKLAKIPLGLFDSEFRKIMDIRDIKIPDSIKPGLKLLAYYPIVAVSPTAFFVNWGPEGREIAVFDLDGRMKRLIRAEFPSLPMPSGYRKATLDQIPQNLGKDIRDLFLTMETFPPFQSFVADDNGRLFVVGFDKEPVSGTNISDVFSPDGVRLMRTGLGFQDLLRDLWEMVSRDVVLKNNRFYGVHEKPSGFKEVVVYSMLWR